MQTNAILLYYNALTFVFYIPLLVALIVFYLYTGLAYIDVYSLSINDITEENGRLWIRKSRYKTNVMYHVPILKPAKEILDKYASLSHKEGKLLPVLSNQKMNAYLKEIAGIVGISKDLTTHLAKHHTISI